MSPWLASWLASRAEYDAQAEAEAQADVQALAALLSAQAQAMDRAWARYNASERTDKDRGRLEHKLRLIRSFMRDTSASGRANGTFILSHMKG